MRYTRIQSTHRPRNAVFILVLLTLVAVGGAAAGGQGESGAAGRSMSETAGVTDSEVRLGSFQALSGPVASIGIPVKKGMDAFFNHVNSNGGVHGRKIHLTVADDAFDPARTTVEVRRLVEQDNVFALVGGLGAPGNLAVMDYLERTGVPHVYQAAGTGLLTNPPKENIFSVQPNYTVEGAIMARYLVEERGAERIAVVYRNLDDGTELRNAVVNTLEKYDMQPVIDIGIEPAAQDFSANLVRVRRAEPDAVIVMLFLPQSVNFIIQAKELGMDNLEYLTTYANADATFIQLAQGHAEGVETMAWVDVDFTDPDLEVFSVYQETFPGEIPNAFAIAGMIAAEVTTEGLRRAGRDLTRSSFRAALENMDSFTGVIAADIGFAPYDPADPSTRVGLQQMYVLRIKDGIWDYASDWISVE